MNVSKVLPILIALLFTPLTCCHMDDRILWLGTDNGIGYMVPGTGEMFPVVQTEGIYVNRIDSDSNVVYFMTDQGVLHYEKRSETWGHVTDGRGWTNYNVETSLISRDSLFFATPSGVLFIHDKDTTYISTPFNSLGQPILSLARLKSTLYIGTSRGLYTYDLLRKSWVHYSHSQGLREDFIYSLRSDPDSQRILIGTRFGLSILSH